MRKIKFRGKAKMSIEELNDMYFEHDNGWFYGNLVMYGDTPYIVGDFIEVDTEYTINEFWVAVHPESVGQFTGLKDKNGKEIYEGDIAKVNWPKDEDIGVVKYLIDGFFIADMKWHSPTTVANFGIEVEVIGNIYENPELLKEEEEDIWSDEKKIGKCEVCGEKNVEVFASGFYVAFVCKKCLV